MQKIRHSFAPCRIPKHTWPRPPQNSGRPFAPIPSTGAHHEREYLVEESLTHLEEEFESLFVRIHRNCLVARAAISGFERNAEESESGWAVVIKATGEKLPVSRRQHQVVKQFR